MALFLDMRWQDPDGSWKFERVPCSDGVFILPTLTAITVDEAQRRARPETFKPVERREWSLRVIGER